MVYSYTDHSNYCLCDLGILVTSHNIGNSFDNIENNRLPLDFCMNFNLPITISKDTQLTKKCENKDVLDLDSEQKEELYLKLLSSYKYTTRTYYDEHKEKDVTEYTCGYPMCTKVLQKPWNLLDHVRMHEGVKPFLCNWCGKTFTQKGNLKKHARQHIDPDVNERKRYSCRF